MQYTVGALILIIGFFGAIIEGVHQKPKSENHDGGTGNKRLVMKNVLKNVTVEFIIDVELPKAARLGGEWDMSKIDQFIEGKNCVQESHALKGSGKKMEYKISYRCTSDSEWGIFDIALYTLFYSFILLAILATCALFGKSCLFIRNDKNYFQSRVIKAQIVDGKEGMKPTKGEFHRVLVIRSLDAPPATPELKKGGGDDKPATLIV